MQANPQLKTLVTCKRRGSDFKRWRAMVRINGAKLARSNGRPATTDAFTIKPTISRLGASAARAAVLSGGQRPAVAWRRMTWRRSVRWLMKTLRYLGLLLALTAWLRPASAG